MAEPISEEVVAVPHHLLDIIVGENGAGLERVSRYSGSKVILESSMDVKGKQSYLVISGHRRQINLAKKLLNDSLMEDRASPVRWDQRSGSTSPLPSKGVPWRASEKDSQSTLACPSSTQVEGGGAAMTIEAAEKRQKKRLTSQHDRQESITQVLQAEFMQSPPSPDQHYELPQEDEEWTNEYSWAWAYNKDPYGQQEEPEEEDKEHLKQWVSDIIHSPISEKILREEMSTSAVAARIEEMVRREEGDSTDEPIRDYSTGARDGTTEGQGNVVSKSDRSKQTHVHISFLDQSLTSSDHRAESDEDQNSEISVASMSESLTESGLKHRIESETRVNVKKIKHAGAHDSLRDQGYHTDHYAVSPERGDGASVLLLSPTCDTDVSASDDTGMYASTSDSEAFHSSDALSSSETMSVEEDNTDEGEEESDRDIEVLDNRTRTHPIPMKPIPDSDYDNETPVYGTPVNHSVEPFEISQARHLQGGAALTDDISDNSQNQYYNENMYNNMQSLAAASARCSSVDDLAMTPQSPSRSIENDLSTSVDDLTKLPSDPDSPFRLKYRGGNPRSSRYHSDPDSTRDYFDQFDHGRDIHGEYSSSVDDITIEPPPISISCSDDDFVKSCSRQYAVYGRHIDLSKFSSSVDNMTTAAEERISAQGPSLQLTGPFSLYGLSKISSPVDKGYSIDDDITSTSPPKTESAIRVEPTFDDSQELHLLETIHGTSVDTDTNSENKYTRNMHDMSNDTGDKRSDEYLSSELRHAAESIEYAINYSKEIYQLNGEQEKSFLFNPVPLLNSQQDQSLRDEATSDTFQSFFPSYENQTTMQVSQASSTFHDNAPYTQNETESLPDGEGQIDSQTSSPENPTSNTYDQDTTPSHSQTKANTHNDLPECLDTEISQEELICRMEASQYYPSAFQTYVFPEHDQTILSTVTSTSDLNMKEIIADNPDISNTGQQPETISLVESLYNSITTSGESQNSLSETATSDFLSVKTPLKSITASSSENILHQDLKNDNTHEKSNQVQGVKDSLQNKEKHQSDLIVPSPSRERQSVCLQEIEELMSDMDDELTYKSSESLFDMESSASTNSSVVTVLSQQFRDKNDYDELLEQPKMVTCSQKMTVGFQVEESETMCEYNTSDHIRFDSDQEVITQNVSEKKEISYNDIPKANKGDKARTNVLEEKTKNNIPQMCSSATPDGQSDGVQLQNIPIKNKDESAEKSELSPDEYDKQSNDNPDNDRKQHFISVTRGYDEDQRSKCSEKQQHLIIHLILDKPAIPTTAYTDDLVRISVYLTKEERPAIFTKTIALLAKLKSVSHNVYTESKTREISAVPVATIDVGETSHKPCFAKLQEKNIHCVDKFHEQKADIINNIKVIHEKEVTIKTQSQHEAVVLQTGNKTEEERDLSFVESEETAEDERLDFSLTEEQRVDSEKEQISTTQDQETAITVKTTDNEKEEEDSSFAEETQPAEEEEFQTAAALELNLNYQS